MNVPDERLRAAEEWLHKNRDRYEQSFAGIVEKCADYAKEREDSAMRKAAGLVCVRCRNGDAPIKNNPGKAQSFRYWTHSDGECAAAPIHERLALKGGQE